MASLDKRIEQQTGRVQHLTGQINEIDRQVAQLQQSRGQMLQELLRADGALKELISMRDDKPDKKSKGKNADDEE